MARRICERKSLEEVNDPNYFQKDYDDNDLFTSYDERQPSDTTCAKIAKVNKLQLKALNMTHTGRRFKTLNLRAGYNTSSMARYGVSKDGKPVNTKTVIEHIFNPQT